MTPENSTPTPENNRISLEENVLIPAQIKDTLEYISRYEYVTDLLEKLFYLGVVNFLLNIIGIVSFVALVIQVSR